MVRSSGDKSELGNKNKFMQSSQDQEGLMHTADSGSGLRNELQSTQRPVEVINNNNSSMLGGIQSRGGDSRGGLEISEALENELSLKMADSQVWTDNNVSSGMSGSEFNSAVPADGMVDLTEEEQEDHGGFVLRDSLSGRDWSGLKKQPRTKGIPDKAVLKSVQSLQSHHDSQYGHDADGAPGGAYDDSRLL